MAPDSRQVERVGDFLVTEELCPGAVRRVGEVLERAEAEDDERLERVLALAEQLTGAGAAA